MPRNKDINYPKPPLPNIDRTTYNLPKDQYVPQSVDKTGIVLHHTVSRSVESVFDWWVEKANRRKVRVGTAYVIGEDGTTYEFFNDDYWAWHLGRGVSNADEARTIGIEIVSEGALTKADDSSVYAFYNANTGKGLKHNKPFIDLGRVWRGYRYFDQYDEPQIRAVIRLVDFLLDKHNIPRVMVGNLWDYNPSIKNLQGVLTHAQVRPDKTDVHPMFPVEELAKWCDMELINDK